MPHVLPLPLASDAGLLPAVAALDGFLPPGQDWQRMKAGSDLLVSGARARVAPVLLLERQLVAEGDTNGHALVLAAWELWDQHPQWRTPTPNPGADVSPVRVAVAAVGERTLWQARRRVANTREARRNAARWSELATLHTPTAVALVDNVARTVNRAALGVPQPTPTPVPSLGGPSWH